MPIIHKILIGSCTIVQSPLCISPAYKLYTSVTFNTLLYKCAYLSFSVGQKLPEDKESYSCSFHSWELNNIRLILDIN